MSNSMKVMVTGASGLLGRAVFQEFNQQKEFTTIGLALSRADENLRKMNLLDFEGVSKLIQQEQPQFVIHTAGERRPDVSEKDHQATTALNVSATANIARAARKAGSWLVYISTDYVFDGSNPPYRPDSQPNPLNYYGKSKLEGEKAVWEVTSAALVLRLPVLYGKVEFLKESSVTTVLESLQTENPQKLDHWAIRYPTLVDDVAVVLRQICRHKIQQNNFRGTFHWSGNEPFTKFEMALKMAEVFRLPANHLSAQEDPASGTPRPKNSHLDSSELEKPGIGQRTPFETGIKKSLESIIETL